MWAARKNSGFTIVELLIVIVVIGILAAIVIVAFNGIQGRANSTAVQSDLGNLVKKLELEKATAGRYPFPPTATMGIKITKGSYADRNNLYYCYDSATDRYAVQARATSNTTYKIVDGKVSEGVAAVTNGFSGAGTCEILGITWLGSTGSLGYSQGVDGAPGTWATWAL